MVTLHVGDGVEVMVTVSPVAAPVAASAEAAGVHAAGLLDRLRPFKRMRDKMIEDAVAAGADRDKAAAVVNEIGDGTLLKLILENWDKIIEGILRLIGAFG